MNRSKKYKLRITQPDIKYNSVAIARFIGKIMRHGMKLKISNYVYKALETVAESRNQNVVDMFNACIEILHPTHRLRPWRIASRVYPLPFLIKDELVAHKQAVYWLSKAVRMNKSKGLVNKIIDEIKAIFDGNGNAIAFVNKRKELSKEYEAYVHYSH